MFPFNTTTTSTPSKTFSKCYPSPHRLQLQTTPDSINELTNFSFKETVYGARNQPATISLSSSRPIVFASYETLMISLDTRDSTQLDKHYQTISGGPFSTKICNGILKHAINARLRGNLMQVGVVEEIVMDNGPPFVAAVNWLAEKYHIHHICICIQLSSQWSCSMLSLHYPRLSCKSLQRGHHAMAKVCTLHVLGRPHHHSSCNRSLTILASSRHRATPPFQPHRSNLYAARYFCTTFNSNFSWLMSASACEMR